MPKGQASGTYDVLLTDQTGCFTVLPKGLAATDQETVTIKEIAPSFGTPASDTAITIKRDAVAAAPANRPFVATPRIFLTPSVPVAGDRATTLTAVSFLDQDTVTAVIPTGTKVGAYDVVVVNSDGSVGVAPKG